MIQHKLTQKAVLNLKSGMHANGGGLYLKVTANARSWIFRFTSPLTGKRREMGLGGFPQVSLKFAREQAAAHQTMVGSGADPIEASKRPAKVSATFKTLLMELIETRKPEWTNDKHAAQWKSSMELYAKPLFNLQIGDLSVRDVLGVLRPIWLDKPETARRVAQRIRSVTEYAEALEIETRNPAAPHKLSKLLPKQQATVVHFRAVPIDQAQKIFTDIWDRRHHGQGARALASVILSCARSGEARKLEWSWIKDDRIAMPVGSMKRKQVSHEIPLTQPMRTLLETVPKLNDCPLVFASSKRGKISDMTLSAVHKRLGIDATPHGWRSVFTEWAKREGVDLEVREDALHHKYLGSTRSAYERSTHFEARKPVMAKWGEWLFS